MARFEKHTYSSPPSRWRALTARKRQDLSLSVEEAMQDAILQEEEEEEERENEEDGADMLSAQASALIPPRLSLQSKQLPLVRPDATQRDEQAGVTAASPVTAPSAPQTATMGARRRPLLTRTTKVRLQVVPAPAEARQAAAPVVPVYETITHHGLADIQEPAAARLPAMGSFERGQRDLALPGACVTASSVVLVVLTGDPGPLVVQYVSLQPGIGFTIHLSAPARHKTPFNFVIL